MKRLTKPLGAVGLGSALVLTSAAPALAEVPAESAFVFNTFSFLVTGFLVMWMAAGFCMLEAGMVRSKNVATMCLKNISLYAVAGIMYFLIGYNLMYSGVDGGFMGSIGLWGADDSAALAETNPDFGGGAGYAAASDWFFQMVFVATAASIVSGTLAERIKVWPFLLFVVVLTGAIYPIQGSWQWGGGWLSEMGFADFAGSTLVHSVGGWAALAGAILLGARKGKYGSGGRVTPIPGSSLPLATLGTFVLWLGWFGFNGGSQLALGSAADAVAMSNIFANTNMAAAGGVVAALVLTQVMYKKMDLTMVLNGALAGLVSITAGPDTPTLGQAILIGAVGGVIVVFAIPLLDKLKIDDVVGAIPVHLLAGIWGTMAVPLTNSDASFMTQFIGVVAIGGFVFAVSLVVWGILKATVGIRLTEDDEAAGCDQAELGLEAYPEFGHGSQSL
ncbi:MAG: ammonium transporter [Rhodospirillales bacterium]|nr:ammonium transporter [Rhodospirillales bacterium]